MGKIMDYCKKPVIIRVYLMSHLYISFTYKAVKNQFYLNHVDARPSDYMRDGSAHSKMSKSNVEELDDPKVHEVADSSRFRWTWRHFPGQPRFVIYYKIISSSTMIYIVVKNILPDPILRIINFFNVDSKIPNECYLFGKLALDFSTLSYVTSALFSCYHLFWRFINLRAPRPLTMNFVSFTMQNDEDIHNFLDAHDSQMSLRVEDSRRISCTQQISSYNCVTFKEMSSRIPTVIRNIDPFEPAEIVSARRSDQLSGYERFMRELLFYRVQYRSKIYYKIRPNRTLEVHSDYKRLVASNMIKTLIFLNALGIPITIIVFCSVFFDWGYHQNYPNCSPSDSPRFSFGLGSEWTVTLTWHRLVSFVFDFFENLFVWLDSGCALVFAHSFISLLNEDMLVYWRTLHADIESALLRVKINYVVREYLSTYATSKEEAEAQSGSPEIRPKIELMSGDTISVNSQMQASGEETHVSCEKREQELRPATNRIAFKTPQELEQSLVELQAEISDFFHQIRQIDLFVSDQMTIFLVILLSRTSFLSYHALMNSREGIPNAVKLLQSFDFVSISITSFYMFRLYSASLKSYKLLCSLMAYDQSRHKRRFTKMLDYYVGGKHFNYTVFRQYPYTPTTFLSIIGWAVSCFFIIDSLFKCARQEKKS